MPNAVPKSRAEIVNHGAISERARQYLMAANRSFHTFEEIPLDKTTTQPETLNPKPNVGKVHLHRNVMRECFVDEAIGEQSKSNIGGGRENTEQQTHIEGEHHQCSTPKERSGDINAAAGESLALPSIQEESELEEPKQSVTKECAAMDTHVQLSTESRSGNSNNLSSCETLEMPRIQEEPHLEESQHIAVMMENEAQECAIEDTSDQCLTRVSSESADTATNEASGLTLTQEKPQLTQPQSLQTMMDNLVEALAQCSIEGQPGNTETASHKTSGPPQTQEEPQLDEPQHIEGMLTNSSAQGVIGSTPQYSTEGHSEKVDTSTHENSEPPLIQEGREMGDTSASVQELMKNGTQEGAAEFPTSEVSSGTTSSNAIDDSGHARIREKRQLRRQKYQEQQRLEQQRLEEMRQAKAERHRAAKHAQKLQRSYGKKTRRPSLSDEREHLEKILFAQDT